MCVCLYNLYEITISPHESRASLFEVTGGCAAQKPSESGAFTKMTLPQTSIRHVIPTRTRINARRMWYKRRTGGGEGGEDRPIPPLSISRAHVYYNYLQVITTHTTVFQWVLTAVRPLYSAKLVFPFPVEKRAEETERIVSGREKEKETEKRRNFRRPLVGPRFNAPRVLSYPLTTLSPNSFVPRSPRPYRRTYRRSRTCLFL